MHIAGVMSGTSIDGIDVAICEIVPADPGTLTLRVLGYGEQPFPDGLRARIMGVLTDGQGALAELTGLQTALGQAFAGAVQQTVADLKLPAPDLVACHGQTIYHLTTGERGTWQMGNPAIIAAHTGATVVSDFRAADMARGGEGAPLVPYLDALLFHHPTLTRAVQNIGGIGNVTFLPAPGEPYAFDTGPGNMLIDQAARSLLGLPFDRDGAVASAGRIDEAFLEEILVHPYFHRAPPKSTGREMFGAAFGNELLTRAVARGLSPAETLATLTAVTAESIARGYRAFGPGRIDEIVVSGGGARNPTLLHLIAERLPASRLTRSDDLGLPSDAKEAVAFALLGYEAIHGRAGTLPRCTGASQPSITGSITPGANFRALMRQAMKSPSRNIEHVHLRP
ncbi:MAG TPA: anhydro-N-acetylmuramic acid kinase [Chloroflexota bacterium]|nr:anhydro-N-acetylmuramic acid kinase [Chloroflexota bacterium]